MTHKSFLVVAALAGSMVLPACANPSGNINAGALGPTGEDGQSTAEVTGAAADSSDASEGLDIADAALDTGADGASDAALDTALDTGADAAPDSGPDVKLDTAPDVAADVAPDTGPDAVTPSDPLQPCDSHSDCTGSAKVCDLQIHACVECKAAADCKAGDHCSADHCVAGVACTSDVSCKASQQLCDKASGACVDCNSNADCGANQLCVQQLCKSAAPCKSSKECPAVCSTAKGICQECLATADCTAGLACVGGNCLAPVCVQDSCAGGKAFVCQGGGAYSAGKPCNDGVACTTDGCSAGACSFVANAASCEDSNVCTADSCGAKGCVHAAVGGPCDDGDLCSVGDSCASGSCALGKLMDCDDANPCTTDSCKVGTCSHAANSSACDDANACTSGDKCAQGKCSGVSAVTCDDKDPCTADSCNPQTGNCATIDICGIKTVTLPYSEAMACGGLPSGWSAEAKSSGSNAVWAVDSTPAAPGAKSPACSLNFNDGVGLNCTKDIVSMVTLPRLDASLVAKDQPLVLRFWLGGTWAPYVDTGLALWTSADGKAWEVAATYNSPKSGWIQVATPLPKYIGTKFFAKFSFYATKCSSVQGSGPFIDDLEVLSLPCKVAACVDGNPCTQDTCDLWTAKCSHPPDLSAACTDGKPCTGGDFCYESECLGGILDPCDDGNACTTDKCDPTTGKCSTAAGSCDDGNSCTVDSCDAGTGACTSTPSAGSCSDGNACTVSDICTSGQCTAGTAKVCNDQNPCSVDSCDTGSGGCVVKDAVAGTPCDDGDLCTMADSCVKTTCEAGPAKACDDGNACTTDSCSAGACQFVKNSAPCSDGNACTLADVCSEGQCKPGVAKSCNDNNACTSDGCTPLTGGCTSTAIPNASPCDDGDLCSTSDACKAGACVGIPKVCTAPATCSAGLCKLPAGASIVVPAGSFSMGCVAIDSNCAKDEKPQRTVTLSSFEMDVYEVSVKAYAECVAAGKCTTPKGSSSAECNYGKVGRSLWPMNCLNWYEAGTYCKASGKRLPTEAEWERAARGGVKDTIYPWSNAFPSCTPGASNQAVFFDSANGSTWGCFKGWPWDVGTASAPNAYGLFDMSGNVWEWVSDWYGVYDPFPKPDPQGPTSSTTATKVQRGGGYASPGSSLRSSVRRAVDPDDIVNGSGNAFLWDVGFRCARSLP